MSDHPSAPRLAPLTLDQMTGDQRELVSGAGSGQPMNIFATLVRAPGLYRRWSPFRGQAPGAGRGVK